MKRFLIDHVAAPLVQGLGAGLALLVALLLAGRP